MKYFMDLFAGCGGLSLGLEQSGFMPIYVSEVNHDAMETYLVNRDSINPLLREKHHDNDIRQLTQKEGRLEYLIKEFDQDYGIGHGDMDLIVGGPPCQGFSGIGHRRSFDIQKKELPYNHLYKDMIKAIKYMKPKCFMFENVGGLLSGKWDSTGYKGEIWDDVYEDFKSLNYNIQWELVHSKSYGVPQNRPRIIMVGIRKDIPYDVDEGKPAQGFLPDHTNDWVHPEDLLSDLVDPDYLNKKSTNIYLEEPKNHIQKELRGDLAKGDRLTDQEYPNHSKRIVEKFSYMIDNDGIIPEKYKTKKFSTPVLPKKWKDGPNITLTSNPDFIHYSQPRNLTVREYARFQTFPDSYMFTGNRHTGGRRRAGDPDKGIWKREVPKYTQVANAVPVKMARIIGKHLFELIKS